MTRSRALLGLAAVVLLAAAAQHAPGAFSGTGADWDQAPLPASLVALPAPAADTATSVEDAIARAVAEGDLERAADLAAAEIVRVSAASALPASPARATTAH